MFAKTTMDLAQKVIAALAKENKMIVTAESCTGGLLAGALTSVPGSSEVVYGGFVTYANQAKTDMLGVDARLIQSHGAVSEPVAIAMAEGAILPGGIDISVSVTGIAGPGGASVEKPVGLVHLASARTESPTLHERHVFDGDREKIRLQAIDAALKLLLQQAQR